MIYYIGVHPKFQGRGIGKKLVRRAEKYFTRFSADLSLASTTEDNIKSRKFFSDLGYVEYTIKEVEDIIGEWGTAIILRKLWIWGDDDIIMIKPLKPSLNRNKRDLLLTLYK